MNTAARLGAYAGGLAVVFGAAFAAGAAADPVSPAPARSRAADGEGTSMGGMTTNASPHAAAPVGAATLPGLAISQDGYTLVPATTRLTAGDRVPFRFTVTGPDGRPVTRFTATHTKNLHLIVVRRDMAGFQHVHPTLGPGGTWSVPLDVSAAGTYRVFADFTPAGHTTGLTLGTDLAVAGDYQPRALPEPAVSTAVDGYDVALGGVAVAGRESELTFTVSRNGAKVTDLQPYLGAFGHLVSLRAGDLAYLHTHPAEEATSGQRGGPAVRFGTTFPTPGTYRLFLDFRAGGTIRTAELTVTVREGST
jgi:hypothetical protein